MDSRIAPNLQFPFGVATQSTFPFEVATQNTNPQPSTVTAGVQRAQNMPGIEKRSMDIPSEPRKRRYVSKPCDLCHKDHQPCDGGRPMCLRCLNIGRDSCTYDRPYQKRGPKAPSDDESRTPLNDQILGLVFRSNPLLETLILHELRHGKQPGTGIPNMDFLREAANQPTLIEAYKSSRVAEFLVGNRMADQTVRSNTVGPVPGLSLPMDHPSSVRSTPVGLSHTNPSIRLDSQEHFPTLHSSEHRGQQLLASAAASSFPQGAGHEQVGNMDRGQNIGQHGGNGQSGEGPSVASVPDGQEQLLRGPRHDSTTAEMPDLSIPHREEAEANTVNLSFGPGGRSVCITNGGLFRLTLDFDGPRRSQ
ncbi:hypothetical protein F4677DRAFT_445262 [Hypoxylon crocopeplum]|nr:hypothetical protein F4677DRAFT_445262 [Hypoxylon crocopeplum]